MILVSPIDAGRAAMASRQPRSSNPYRLDAATTSERAKALAWVRAFDDANPMLLWDDDADPDVDDPVRGPGTTGWRRARMFEEYVRKRYGPDIQVSAGHVTEAVESLVIGRDDRLAFLERTHSAEWGYTDDPDIARNGFDAWETTTANLTTAIARAVELLRPS